MLKTCSCFIHITWLLDKINVSDIAMKINVQHAIMTIYINNQPYWVCVEIIHQIILMLPNTWLSHMFIVWEIVVLWLKTCWFEWWYDSMWLSELPYWVVSQKLFEIMFISKRKWYYDYCPRKYKPTKKV